MNTNHIPLRHRHVALAVLTLATLGVAPVAIAQTAGPGMQLQQSVPPKPQPAAPGMVPAMPDAAPASVAGGASAVLTAVEISGNTLIDSSTLLAAIGDVRGRRYDFAGLDGIARAVTDAYRAQGYIFTRAILPPQNLGSGVLKVEVIEGRYGRIVLDGADPLVPTAQPFIDAALQPEDVIQAKPLERAMLLLNDQPGFRVQPTMRPGAYRGDGDLHVAVERRNRWSADVGLDNAGSRATGLVRARGSVSWNSPWRFGDRLTLTALVTDEAMWLGSADYETPLGGDGWRAGASLARTSYQLGGEFADLDASGRADTMGVRLSYPVVRSQRSNVSVSVQGQHKALHEGFNDGLLTRDKSSNLAVLGLQFDHRDGLWGGGVTYGALNLTLGKLSLDADSATADAATARTAGSFAKWNLDISRIQRLPGAFSAFLRLSVQGANQNLDASEKLGLGGFLGVRAYPLGEASGDQGWLSQLELRHAQGEVTWFLFHDMGRMRANHSPWAPDADATRSIAGSGVGLRWLHGDWSAELTVADRSRGGPAIADSTDTRPRVFAVVGRHFE